MKKKYHMIIIGMFLVVLLVLAGTIYFKTSEDVNAKFSLKMNERSEDLSEEFKSNQVEAIMISERFLEYLRKKHGTTHDSSVYTVNGLRAENFPEYYAGSYINEDGKLIVQVVDKYYSSKYKKSDWYQELVGIVESENFYCHPVKHSYCELVNAISNITLGELARQIKNLGITTYVTQINDYKNCVTVCFENQNDYDAFIDKFGSDIYSASIVDIQMQVD